MTNKEEENNQEKLMQLLRAKKLSAEDRECRKERDKLRQEFLKQFPLDSLASLTLDEYCMNGNRQTFCWWWGIGTKKILGINLRNNYLGAWYDPDEGMYQLDANLKKYKESKPGQTDEDVVRERVFKPLAAFIKSKGTDLGIKEYDNTIRIDYLLKLLVLYYYNEFFPIAKQDWLNTICEAFGLQLNGSPIDKNLAIKKFSDERLKEIGDSSLDYSAVYSVFDQMFGLEESKGGKMNESKVKDKSSQKDDMVDSLVEMVKKSHNVVLTGAPGTGKTFLARKVARAMVLSDAEKKLADEKKLSEEELIESRTCFVQFHPSYDYTDFVEGLRPIQDADGQVGFERQDGAFKKLCHRAVESGVVDRVDNFESAWSELIAKLNEQEVIQISLISGRGKFPISLNESGNGLTSPSDIKGDETPNPGYPKYFTKEQVYNVYLRKPGVPSGGHDNYRKAIVEYMREHCQLKEFSVGRCVKVETEKQRPYVMIIDEINRGDISKIFGELFYAIDEGYRGPQGRVSTQYQNLVKDGDPFFKGFYVPENVYIIGTMNDIDRSVESMDFAIRRRFTWFEVQAKSEVLKDAKDENNEPKIGADILDEARNRMDNLNVAIRNDSLLGSAYEIGPAYFLKLKQYKDDKDETGFDNLWKMNLELLLREYLRGNPKKEIEEKIKAFRAAFDDKSQPSEEDANKGGSKNNG